MPFVPAEETLARPRLTIHAAEIFHAHACAIARNCAEAGEDDVVLATVDRFLSFGGTWLVHRSQLLERVQELGEGGWTLLFSPGSTVREVETRSLELARHAMARWEALRRWTSAHRASGCPEQ